MKNNSVIRLITVLVCAGLFFACKKDKGAQPGDQAITVQDVTGYYMVMEFSQDVASTLGIAYFTFSEPDIFRVNALYKSGSASASAYLEGNVLSFEGFGDSGFKVMLKRDEAGDLLMTEYDYNDPERSQDRIVHAQLHKVSAMPGFENGIFQQADIANSYLKFMGNGDTGEWWWHNNPNFAGATANPYSKNGKGSAWTSTGLVVAKHLGVCVPFWKDVKEPLMLVQNTTNRKTIVVFKPL